MVELEVPYDEALDPAAVGEELERHGDIELVALVHSETPSGIENPLAEIAPLAKRAGALVFADVVSAVGGTNVRTDDWGVDICVAGPQKCLAGPPGMSLVVVSDEAWAAIEANPNAPRGSFLSLLDWRETWIEGGRVKYPYTPSVSDVNGVHAAVGECLEEGLDTVIARHEAAARACREGVKAMGLELWARSESYAANCVTAIRCPEGVEVKSTPLAHPRALRRDALRRLWRARRTAVPDRAHGPGRPFAVPARRGIGARPRIARPRGRRRMSAPAPTRPCEVLSDSRETVAA